MDRDVIPTMVEERTREAQRVAELGGLRRVLRRARHERTSEQDVVGTTATPTDLTMAA